MSFQRPSILLRSGIKRTFLVMFGIWTLLIAAVLSVTYYYSTEEDREIALNRAMDSYHKDLAYRRWAAERGGVYVPLEAKTPPNPYLADVPHRDLTTREGVRLTLVNPAYMTRMVHELGKDAYGLQGHITSLDPIRPENAPDTWERKALEAFGRGAREFSEVVKVEGRPTLRFMGAFSVEASCLACHGQQGYKIGDIRGGISVTVPVGTAVSKVGLTHKGISLLTILSFWVLGGTGMALWVRRLARSTREQRRLVAELEDSALRFRHLFQSSPAPMIIHRDGLLFDANQAAAHLLDAEDPSQVIGLEVLSFVHPEDRQRAAQRIQMAQGTGTSNLPIEETLLTLRGREISVEAQSVPLDLPGGTVVLTFAQDLTDRRRSEETRRELEAEVHHAQKLDSLGSLAGGIAHDMNNVLAAILGMASLLQIKREGDDLLVKSLRTIENAAGRGRDLVKGLTDFARKDLQKAKVMDLNALIRKELDLLVRTSRQRFTFEVELAEPLPPIMGESSTLGSAFMNLCVNAFDAMPKGGTLRVRTSLEGHGICLTVGDTGEGIAPEILPRVTDPFFTTKPAGRGTGLGLAMVYGTVKAHGGTLEIHSEVGLGTVIRLWFPAAETKTASEASVGPSAAIPERSLRILVVDDDEIIRGIMPPMLEQLGHQVETASGGLEAIRRLAAGLEADLVILDHNMPGLSGADTLPRLLQLRPAIRIIISTGFLDQNLKLLLADFPSILTLHKPFSLAELRQVIRASSIQPEG